MVMLQQNQSDPRSKSWLLPSLLYRLFPPSLVPHPFLSRLLSIQTKYCRQIPLPFQTIRSPLQRTFSRSSPLTPCLFLLVHPSPPPPPPQQLLPPPFHLQSRPLLLCDCSLTLSTLSSPPRHRSTQIRGRQFRHKHSTPRIPFSLTQGEIHPKPA